MTDPSDDAPEPGFTGDRPMSEEEKGRGVFWRAFFYIAGTHFLAAFIALLFYVGEHANK